MKPFASVWIAAVALLPYAAAQTVHNPVAQLPPAERWLSHLSDELLPFWTHPAALGARPGAFPSTRCDDGSAVDYARPCPEVAQNAWLMQPQRTVVALSRQTYAYGVAFHLTGERKYLDYMHAGLRFLRRKYRDHRGGMYTTHDLAANAWGAPLPHRNPQELAYSLLGIGMGYYLTRDPELLRDLLAVKNYIFARYDNPHLNALQWMLRSTASDRAEEKRLVAQLDQLNAYLVLVTPILPEPYRTEWTQSLTSIADRMIAEFYSPQENLFFLSANRPEDLDLAVSGTDFGHTIKAMWMIRMAGQLAGRADLIRFAEDNGARVLARAYLPDSRSWAQGVLPGGAVDPNKSWWIYAELDQFAASLALAKPEAAAYLSGTYDYWFRFFVDAAHQEVWTGVRAAGNQPDRAMPKQWPWKNAYHSFEHALVGYITTRALRSEPVTLYFAFPTLPELVRPYFYTGIVDHAEHLLPAGGAAAWAVTFRDVR